MIKSVLAATTLAFLIAGPVYAQDMVTTCDDAAIAKLEADVMKQTSTNKDPSESPISEKNDMVAKEVSSAKAALVMKDLDQCVVHINKAMEAMKEPV